MKVRIGSNYFPKQFVRRGADGSYSALRPEPSADMERLQATYLDERYGKEVNLRPLGWWVLLVIAAVGIAFT